MIRSGGEMLGPESRDGGKATGVQLLKVKEVAEALRVSASLVYALIESGRLPACRVGRGRGSVRVLADDLTAYIKGSRVQVGEATRPRPRRKEKLKHIRL